MVTQDVEAGPAQPTIPEALDAALSRVLDAQGQKALKQAFAALLAERDHSERRKREWKLFDAWTTPIKSARSPAMKISSG